MSNITEQGSSRTYIDLFSGCGGLSLGLGQAGWKGLFAVEKDPLAFGTFKYNLIEGAYNHFEWPKWLPLEATTIQDLLKKHSKYLHALKGKVDLIAGGPPCQGFSLAGMRNSKDPRNKLSEEYIKMVEIIQPKYLLLENVRGFSTAFKNAGGNAKKIPHSEIVKARIKKMGYEVFDSFINSQKFGVPQSRTRFILIGIRKELVNVMIDPFKWLEDLRPQFLASKGLPLSPVSVKQAISDLEITRKNAKLVKHSGPDGNCFMKLDYKPSPTPTCYQLLMQKGLGDKKPNSLRLARHKLSTVQKFTLIQQICRPGVVLNQEEKEKIGIKKQAICVLDANKPSNTLTTLPDDILHYKEPRILTVRESARIQSFPDNFEFKGKYTTGSNQRTKECPRYTQVGNAVPPLMAEALGNLLNIVQKELEEK